MILKEAIQERKAEDAKAIQTFGGEAPSGQA